MKTFHLIDQLTKDLKKTRPLPKTSVRTLYIMGAMVVGLLLSILFFSFRPDIREVINQKQFIFASVVFLIGWISESYSLALLSLPVNESKKFLLWALTIFGVLALRYVLQEISFHTTTSMSDGLSFAGARCSLDIVFLSLLPGTLVFLILRRGAPTHIMRAGMNVGMCSAILGAFSLQFFCPNSLPIHLLIWHIIVPFIFISGMGIIICKRVLRW